MYTVHEHIEFEEHLKPHKIKLASGHNIKYKQHLNDLFQSTNTKLIMGTHYHIKVNWGVQSYYKSAFVNIGSTRLKWLVCLIKPAVSWSTTDVLRCIGESWLVYESALTTP